VLGQKVVPKEGGGYMLVPEGEYYKLQAEIAKQARSK
jgi:hypothetical protein